MNKTVNEIISEGQNKRHSNHVKAGKNIKVKWKQECVNDFKKIIERNIDYYRQSKEDIISKSGIEHIDINWYEGVFDILDILLKEIEEVKCKEQ